MGVNTWLMKGFFDTIPKELDESARVDGATPAQVFWGVVLPLAAPVLAVIALISFIATLNEFVIASAILETQQKFTLPVGLWQYIDQKYSEHWGPFAAGVLHRRDPGGAAVRLPAALHRRGPDAGLGQGMSVARRAPSTLLDEPHHDGSEHVRRPDDGEPCASTSRSDVDAVVLRYVEDGEGRGVEATPDGDGWWSARFPLTNPVVHYRWLLSGGDARLRLAERARARRPRRSRRGRLRPHDRPAGPDVAPRAPSSTRSSPTASRRPAQEATRPNGPCPVTGTSCRPAAGPETPYEWFGGDLPGVEAHLDHIEALGANVIYLTPIFPAGQHAPLRLDDVRPRRPAARRRRGARVADACRARPRDARDLRPDDEPHRRQARVVRRAASATSTSSTRAATTRRGGGSSRCRS